MWGQKPSFFTVIFVAFIAMTIFFFYGQPAAFAQCAETNESLTKMMAHDGSKYSNFGVSASVSGDYAIIGAPSYFDDFFTPHSGAAYIFNRNQNAWEQEDFDNDGTPDKLIASDGEALDNFGASVSISGDYAIVGAQLHDAGGIDKAGAAYIFKRSGNNWTQEAKLTADDGSEGDEFGEAVSISGDYAVVGAHQADASDGTKDAGAAYVFKRQGDGSWVQEAKLALNDPSEDDAFSKSAVSVYGSESKSHIVVGAVGRYATGAAFTFERNEDGSWTSANELILLGDLSSGDDFGHAVSISQNYAIVGAPHDNIKIDNVTQDDAGASYIFKRGAGGAWSKEAKLTAGLKAKNNDEFGYSVAVSDEGYAVIGARGDDDSGANSGGAAYTFAFRKPDNEPGRWVQIDKITESQGELKDYFGNAAAITQDGSRAIVGAYLDNEKAEDAGAAFAFEICASGPAAPTFEPGEGTYGGLQEVTPQLPDDAENCYYTIKLFFAAEPYYDKTNSTLYDAQISETLTVDGEFQTAQILSMVCYDAQGNRGETATAAYSFYPLAAPTFNPPGGTYTQAQQVTPSLPEGAAESYYTLNGDDPDKNDATGNSIAYAVDGSDGPITVDGAHDETVVLKMVAYNDNADKGGVGEAEYTFDKRLAGPSFDPEGGTYPGPREVTLSPANDAAESWYTTDGSEPEKDGATSTLYETPFTVEGADGETVAVKAVSYTESGDRGRISSASFTFDASAVIITFDPPAGTYSSNQSVTLTLPPDAVETYYTLDGTDPDNTTPTGELYDANTPIEITGNHGDAKTLKAAAYDANGDEITRAGAEYIFDMRLDAPAFDPGTGTYNAAQGVTATVSPDAATTYYTLTPDGTEPDENSTLYEGGPISVDAAHGETLILKMVSYDAQGLKGNVGTAEYVFDKTLDAPTFSPGGGAYNAPVEVSATLDGNADKTYYTEDGSEPDETNELYTGGTITVDGDHGDAVTLKMVSYDAQQNKGLVGAAEYTFDKEGPAKPGFDPNGGTFSAARQVSIQLATDAHETYYTKDGSEPDKDSGTQYFSGSVEIDGAGGETIALKMVSYDALGNKGQTASAEFTFEKMPGDIDGDDDVDLNDALIGLKIVAGVDLAGQTVEMGADVNGDEKIGIEEVLYILMEASGLGR